MMTKEPFLEPKLAYRLQDSLYLNITNSCPNRCRFCIREISGGVGYDLWLAHEPDLAEIIAAIGDLHDYREIVFCGYGEPLTRPEIVVAVSKYLKEQTKIPIRLNTNGLADLFLTIDILPQLQGLIETISISLNAHSASSYLEITQTPYGERAFPALLEFIKRSKRYFPQVIVSVVRYQGLDLEKAKQLATELDVEFRLREYQN